ncbi:DUF530 domain-containing protein [uncultured Methanobrevibacter sp.]|uniref:DUF530 domain-containing protein n=1 Tax=uncultured Methanobrevibacter sp. TaxID=253161 RepID=UPI00261620BF|nr:DUF530 domain-containing protein [uncultured Methanobrevibacter sp.]
MEDSVLVNKAEKYLREISNESISLENIDDFDNFKSLYFKLDDRLNYLQKLKDDMDAQGYTTPFTSLSRYGTKAVADVAMEEVGENSRHNQIFKTKANAKKNILDRVKSAIDSHKIAIGHLNQYGYVKCDSCYKKYSMDDYKKMDSKCTCGCKSFSFKVNRALTHRLEIIPYLPLSGNYMVLRNQLSSYGREALKKVLNILKQERKGVVKTISLVIRFKDENNRMVRKNVTLDSEYVNNYEEEVRRIYGRRVRIEKLRFHRTKPAIIDDQHARTALAIAYVRYCESIINEIKDDILKRRLSDFKRINNYDSILAEFENQTPDFIDKDDVDTIESWRKSKIDEKLKSFNYLDKFGNKNRSLNRDLKIRDSIYKNTLVNIASTLIKWDMFRFYLTTSYNSRKIDIGPFPYIRVELDREQRKVFQTTETNVIEILQSFTDIKIIPVYEMDLLLYEKFKFEKQIKSSNIKFNNAALGAALIHLNSDMELEEISNAFNINESKIKKEIKNIDTIKNPKSDKSKKFLDLIKK